MVARFLIKALGKIGVALLVVAICLLFLLFSPIWVPVIAVSSLREAGRQRRFLRNHEGVVLFCYTSRRGWNEFIVNNVLPVLPPTVGAIRLNARRPLPHTELRIRVRKEVLKGETGESQGDVYPNC